MNLRADLQRIAALRAACELLEISTYIETAEPSPTCGMWIRNCFRTIFRRGIAIRKEYQ